MRSMLVILTLGLMSCVVQAKEQDLLVHGCKMGVAIAQAYLKKDSDFEMQRMHLRCVGGISRRPQIRKEFDAEKSIENKKAYACGLGAGVAAGFYSQPELLNNKSYMNYIISRCPGKL